MNKLVRSVLWMPVKALMRLLPTHTYSDLRIKLINILSNVGITNSKDRMVLGLIRFMEQKKGGVCLEVGGADGIDQSNSLLLERVYGWKCFLVEPVASQHKMSVFFRPEAVSARYAFVSDKTYQTTKEITINVSALGSSISGGQDQSIHTESVPTITLDGFIDHYNIRHIDIFVLDVEGYEIEVLEGYKKNTGVIDYLLVEAFVYEIFNSYALSRNWKFIKKLGNDYLFDLRSQ